jgi:tetratricopeptide (TPR) repeat protein
MIRWIIIFAISLTSLIAEESHIVSYGGLSIACEHECGMIDIDPDMDEIADILNQSIKSLFVFSSPLYFGWGLDENAYPFSPWDIDEDECSVYDWRTTNGIYLPDIPRQNLSFETYLDFQNVVSQLRSDLRFYCLDVYQRKLNHFSSVLPALKKELRRDEFTHAHFEMDGTLEFTNGDEIDRDIPVYSFYQDLQDDIQELNKNLSNSYSEDYDEKQEWLEGAIQKIDSNYKNIFIWCLRHHQPEGIAFKDAIDHFLASDFDYAIAQIRELIEAAETNNVQDELLAKLYLLKGEIQNECCRYSDAIIDLTTAIQKNPSMKESYFERAVSYFELGHFDLAIQDYLTSGIRPVKTLNPTQWGLGMGAGLLEGIGYSITDFIPSLLGSFRGLSDGLWALATDPRGASQELVQTSQNLIKYIQSHSTREMLQDAVPELKELVQKKDQLSDFEKGRLIGLMIGKYGMEILSTKYSTEAIGAYRKLKKANQLLTLEALASPEQTQTILSAAGKRWELRQTTLKNNPIVIEWDKQGKHIVGHKNYKIKDEKSIFTHPDPEQLLRDYAGTGTKARGIIPGSPGYQEIVNFEEFIGYTINSKKETKIATTYGKIHYSTKGAHIVPFSPQN